MSRDALIERVLRLNKLRQLPGCHEQVTRLEQSLGGPSVGATDRRKCQRHEMTASAVMKILADDERDISVRVEDIGCDGVRLQPAPYLALGDRVRLSIVSSDTSRNYCVEAEVRWVQRSRDVSAMGLEFQPGTARIVPHRPAGA